MNDVQFSCKEVARMTGVKVGTVWDWIQQGKLKASRPGGKIYVIKEDDLKEFIANNERKMEERRNAE